jgi:hypothetical protein
VAARDRGNVRLRTILHARVGETADDRRPVDPGAPTGRGVAGASEDYHPERIAAMVAIWRPHDGCPGLRSRSASTVGGSDLIRSRLHSQRYPMSRPGQPTRLLDDHYHQHRGPLNVGSKRGPGVMRSHRQPGDTSTVAGGCDSSLDPRAAAARRSLLMPSGPASGRRGRAGQAPARSCALPPGPSCLTVRARVRVPRAGLAHAKPHKPSQEGACRYGTENKP